jgi:RimJ/RimL family protein N-acetyltransferase
MDIDWVCRTAHLGILIGDRNRRGKGIGRDAVKLLLGYAFDTLNLRRIEMRVLASHDAAVKLYETSGFVVEGRLRQAYYSAGTFVDVLVMALLRNDHS